MARLSRLGQALSPQRTGIVLFDALNGYLHPDDPEKVRFLTQRNILPNMQRLLAGARAAGIPVFYPCGAHSEDGADTVLRLTDTDMDLQPGGGVEAPIKPRFPKSSTKALIAPEVAPVEGDVVIPKRRWNAFHQTDLDLQLRVRCIETIVLCGGSTDVGIASTAFAARDLDYGLVIVRDCCYSMRGDNNAFFMERVFPRMSRIMDADAAVALMAP